MCVGGGGRSQSPAAKRALALAHECGWRLGWGAQGVALLWQLATTTFLLPSCLYQVIVVGSKADLTAVAGAGGKLASFFPADSAWVVEDLLRRVSPGTDAPSTATAPVSGGTQVRYSACRTRTQA